VADGYARRLPENSLAYPHEYQFTIEHPRALLSKSLIQGKVYNKIQSVTPSLVTGNLRESSDTIDGCGRQKSKLSCWLTKIHVARPSRDLVSVILLVPRSGVVDDIS
jgi:hypothetical protein